jgi:hypothetical protein
MANNQYQLILALRGKALAREAFGFLVATLTRQAVSTNEFGLGCHKRIG